MGIPPLIIKIMLESNPLKSTMLVGRLGVTPSRGSREVGTMGKFGKYQMHDWYARTRGCWGGRK